MIWSTRGENVAAVMNLSPVQREQTLGEYEATRCKRCGVCGDRCSLCDDVDALACGALR